jgi:hypothetical protein
MAPYRTLLRAGRRGLTPRRTAAAAAAAVAIAVAISACGGGDGGSSSSTQAAAARAVQFADVQAIFNRSCIGCHPSVVQSLDLTAAKSYAGLVGVRAVEAPDLVRVVAGDPDRSFLWLKVAGLPGDASRNPGVGGRMPQGQGPLPQADLDTIRAWIEQGAKNADGTTVSAAAVATPGSLQRVTLPDATTPDGQGTIAGHVYDDRGQPLKDAIVTLLLVGASQPGGEEHYRATIAGPDGSFRLDRAPPGRVLLKAYAPGMVYTSRIVGVEQGREASVDIGLTRGTVQTPTVGNPAVQRAGGTTTIAMDVSGPKLDRNYTLAVHPADGIVVELHSPDGADAETPGRWSATVDGDHPGPWILFAVDHGCLSSEFLRSG